MPVLIRASFLSLAVFTTAVFSGCSDSGEQTQEAGSSTETPDTSLGEEGSPDGNGKTGTDEAVSVELKIVSFEELQTLIASKKGQIVVCDYWSTSCGPCVEEFPHLVELSKQYGGGKVVCISASLDFEDLEPIEDCHKNALAFLTEQKATFENVLLSEDNLTVLDDFLKVPSIPIVEVYGTDGTLKKRFDETEGEFTYEKDVLPFVEQLVAETSGE